MRLPRNIDAHRGNEPIRRKKGKGKGKDKDEDADKSKDISGSGSDGLGTQGERSASSPGLLSLRGALPIQQGRNTLGPDISSIIIDETGTLVRLKSDQLQRNRRCKPLFPQKLIEQYLCRRDVHETNQLTNKKERQKALIRGVRTKMKMNLGVRVAYWGSALIAIRGSNTPS
jgi:hypothetical protein